VHTVSGQLVTNLLLKTGADGRLNLEVDHKTAVAAGAANGGGNPNRDVTQPVATQQEPVQYFIQPSARLHNFYVQSSRPGMYLASGCMFVL